MVAPGDFDIWLTGTITFPARHGPNSGETGIPWLPTSRERPVLATAVRPGQTAAVQKVLPMRIAMVGTGYVGLVSAACLSEFGHHVVCIDSDVTKISNLNAGQVPIFEPGLEEVIGANVRARRLSFTSQLGAAVAGADAVF